MTGENDPNGSVIFGLDLHARSLAPVPAEKDKSVFLAGTQSLKSNNQIYYLEFDEYANRIAKQCSPFADGEIWHIAVCQCRPNFFATCYQSVQGEKVVAGCKLCRLVETEGDHCVQISVESVANLSIQQYRHATAFVWNPINESKAIAVVDNCLLLVDLDNEMGVLDLKRIDNIGRNAVRIVSAKWDPHQDAVVVAAAVGPSVFGWDTRSAQASFAIENAHTFGVRDVDFNPNRPYVLATGGDDGNINFWDTRKIKERLNVFNHHSHWVWMVRYNPIHDQLLLSCSSDCNVALNSIASLSSELYEKSVLNVSEDEEATFDFPDGLIKLYAEHEDSVYCCEWSANDPCLFASLSYDGRLVISRVPKQIKYGVLKL